MEQPTPGPDTVPVSVMPGLHGGTLRVGNPGNKGGPGSTPNAIRRKLRKIVAQRPQFIADVIDGKPMQRIRLRVDDLAEHLTCSNCGEASIVPKDEKSAVVEISVTASANVGDRIDAYDKAAKYGLGTLKEVSIDAVRERVIKTVSAIRTHPSLTPEQAEAVVAALKPIWA